MRALVLRRLLRPLRRCVRARRCRLTALRGRRTRVFRLALEHRNALLPGLVQHLANLDQRHLGVATHYS
eukprot:6185491-Pleurochrysis_carterae.AAC.1